MTNSLNPPRRKPTEIEAHVFDLNPNDEIPLWLYLIPRTAIPKSTLITESWPEPPTDLKSMLNNLHSRPKDENQS